MTIEETESTKDELLLAVKNSLDLLNKESETKDKVHKKTEKTLNLVRDCLGKINITITRMETEQKGFIEARRDRSLNCDKIHADFEERLRDHPPSLRIAHEQRFADLEKKSHICVLGKRMETVEGKVEKLTPFMYKVIGSVAVIAIIVPPIISALFAFVMQQISSGKVPTP